MANYTVQLQQLRVEPWLKDILKVEIIHQRNKHRKLLKESNLMRDALVCFAIPLVKKHGFRIEDGELVKE